MTDAEKKEVKKGMWKQRRWRLAAYFNFFFSMLFALVLLVMVNYLVFRYGPRRMFIGSAGMYQLSEKTVGLIDSLEDKVTIYSFFEKENGLYDDVRLLLAEYEYKCRELGQENLEVNMIDPSRDLKTTRDLRKKYGIDDPNVVVVECKSRVIFVDTTDIIKVTPEVDMEKLLAGSKSAYKKKVLFMGEVAMSSAIQSVSQSATPVVYFLYGHSERDILSFHEQVGYSKIARSMQRDNMILQPLYLGEHKKIPDDCSVLVIAGPDRKLSQAEVSIVSDYLDRNGRALFLIDPATKTGMEGLLKKWGVKLGNGQVQGLSIRGRTLIVRNYGDHKITEKLKSLTTMFLWPRSVEPIDQAMDAGADSADRPRVTVLASNTKHGYEELNLNQNPPKYDEGVDVPGPNSIAVAVEKGATSGIDIELKPTRIVVIGDSDFVSNGSLKGASGGNEDFFMSSMNWLVERESIMAVAPKIPGKLFLGMNDEEERISFAIIVLGIPAAVAFFGFVVWLRRRR